MSSDLSSVMAATCNYIHRDGKGKIVSVGRTKTDWFGRVHAIQRNYRTGEVIEAIWLPDGKLEKTKVNYTLRVKFLRLVGLRKK